MTTRTPHRFRRSLLARSIATSIAMAVVAAACGSGSQTAAPAAEIPEVRAGQPLAAERCAANRNAGTIRFLTGFDFAAAASIVEVIYAAELGYYEEMCLDVEILSSFSTANYPLVASGQGQFASGGSFSEVMAFATANEADLVAVSIAGATPIDTLILKPEVTSSGSGGAPTPEALRQSTIGVKGKLPASIEVMLLRAGLREGVDYTTVPVDGFDPTAHIMIPAIVGFPGWKSNEPGRLEREGFEFVTLDPTEAEIPGSFGAIFTTRSFIEQHTSAAEDFVRATLKGLAAAIAEPQAAATAAVDLVIANGNPNFLSPEGEVFRWATEAELIAARTEPGRAPGTPDSLRLATEVEAYAEVGFFGPDASPDPTPFVDASLAAGVTDAEGRVIWPAAD